MIYSSPVPFLTPCLPGPATFSSFYLSAMFCPPVFALNKPEKDSPSLFLSFSLELRGAFFFLASKWRLRTRGDGVVKFSTGSSPRRFASRCRLLQFSLLFFFLYLFLPLDMRPNARKAQPRRKKIIFLSPRCVRINASSHVMHREFWDVTNLRKVCETREFVNPLKPLSHCSGL